MSKKSETIVKEIEDHISNCKGNNYSDYYAGIAKKPENRLFNEHNVNKINGCRIFIEAIDIENARNAEKTLLNKGMKGGDGGGDDSSIYVYCYEITPRTKE